MKGLIRKFLFGSSAVRQYATFSLFSEEIQEEVFLINGEKKIDVSSVNFCLCQDPFLVGVWVSREESISDKRLILEITKSKKTIIEAKCKISRTIPFDSGRLLILEVGKKSFHFMSTLRQKAMIAYFYYQQKHKVTFAELDNFSAMYSFPRPVILTCFGKAHDYNIFPMDLQGGVPEEGLHFLGLRNTNVTLKKMLAEKKVVVCGIDAKYKDTIFQLGSHHSKEPPPPDQLPFGLLESELFSFLVPDIVQSYKELEIVQHFNEGSHTIMICRIRNHRDLRGEFRSMHHLHVASVAHLGCDYEEV